MASVCAGLAVVFGVVRAFGAIPPSLTAGPLPFMRPRAATPSEGYRQTSTRRNVGVERKTRREWQPDDSAAKILQGYFAIREIMSIFAGFLSEMYTF